MKLFGREPAAWLGIIEAIMVTLMAFSLGISQTTFGPIMAVVVAVFGLYTAYVTHETMLAVIVGFAKALFVLGAVYGFAFTDNQTASVIALITVVAALYNRGETSPAVTPGFSTVPARA